MSNTARNLNPQTETETPAQSEKAARERMDLAPWLTDIAHPVTGEILGKGIVLDNASHLQASEKGRETFGGMIPKFTDPVTNRPCTFINDKGETVVGKCAVRLFEEDAAALVRTVGEPVGKESQLVLLLAPGTDAAVYRKENEEVHFLVIRRSQVLGAALQAPKIGKLW